MTTIHAVHVDRFETGLAVLVSPSGRQFRVPQSCVHDLPPSATEAERRLVEAMVEWLPLYSASPKYVVSVLGSAAANALNAVRAERKPPDPVDPVEEVIAAWRQIADAGNVGEYQDRMGRMDRAINALAASRSDKT